MSIRAIGSDASISFCFAIRRFSSLELVPESLDRGQEFFRLGRASLGIIIVVVVAVIVAGTPVFNVDLEVIKLP